VLVRVLARVQRGESSAGRCASTRGGLVALLQLLRIPPITFILLFSEKLVFGDPLWLFEEEDVEAKKAESGSVPGLFRRSGRELVLSGA
jgi:hypothetical protein